MDIKILRAFFGWCTILNGGLLIFSALIMRLAGDWVLGVQHQWIPIPADAFNLAIYSLLGFFKIIFIVFNVVPYIALVIIGRSQASKSVEPTPTR